MTVRFQNLSALVLVGTIAGCVTGAVDPMGSPKSDTPLGAAGSTAAGGRRFEHPEHHAGKAEPDRCPQVLPGDSAVCVSNGPTAYRRSSASPRRRISRKTSERRSRETRTLTTMNCSSISTIHPGKIFKRPRRL